MLRSIPSVDVSIADLRNHVRWTAYEHVVDLSKGPNARDFGMHVLMWCAQNTKDKWSFLGNFKHPTSPAVFAFRNVNDAIFFKMRFY